MERSSDNTLQEMVYDKRRSPIINQSKIDGGNDEMCPESLATSIMKFLNYGLPEIGRNEES